MLIVDAQQDFYILNLNSKPKNIHGSIHRPGADLEVSRIN